MATSRLSKRAEPRTGLAERYRGEVAAGTEAGTDLADTPNQRAPGEKASRVVVVTTVRALTLAQGVVSLLRRAATKKGFAVSVGTRRSI
jgi:hypothetical protein